MKLAFLIVVGIIARHAYGDPPEAIVGGNVATAGQFPYQVSLQVFGIHTCGGSLISVKHVLTAAHCVESRIHRMFMKAIIGATSLTEKNGVKHRIKCIRSHPEYTGKMEDGLKNDIAVITLRTPIVVNSLRSPIALASRDYADGVHRGLISGWGKTSAESSSSPVLKWIAVKILSQKHCLNEYKKDDSGDSYTDSKQICALEKVGIGACQGDSGGPLVVNRELVGVVSWSMLCAVGAPDVLINVFYYQDFIKESQNMC